MQAAPSASAASPPSGSLGKTGWTAAILLAGFAAGLFSIVIYQIFNFFGISWLLFANLLFMGFPIGGYLCLRFLDGKEDAFARGLGYLLAAMLLSLAIFFLLKYPTSWWTGSVWSANAVSGLLKLSLATALPFLPFFVAYGVMEVAGYRAGQRIFGSRANRVYSLYLFGLGLGYAFFSLTISSLGVFRMGLVALVAWGLARVPVPGPGRQLGVGVLVSALALTLLPGLDAVFFRNLHPGHLLAAGDRIEIGRDYAVIHEQWDRAGHLTLLDSGQELLGAYVPIAAWGFERNGPAYAPRDLRRAVFRTLPPDADVLIIGTGGGRDVAQALESEPRSLVAVEIRRSVIEALQGPFRDKVNGVYNHPSVTPVVMNGRKYLEGTDRRFDLIYLPAVDGLLINTRTILDSSEHMHTYESFATMKARLKPGGVLAVARISAFDPRQDHFRRVFNHIESVGLTPLGLVGQDGYVVFGFDEEGAGVPANPRRYRGLERHRVVRDLAEPVALVHDDKPYGAGLPGAIIPARHIVLLFGLQLAVFALIAGTAWYALARRRTVERWPIEHKSLVMLAGILVGANFLALEYELVFILLRYLEQPLDAIFAATVLFLLVTGLGSLLHGYVPARIELVIVALSLLGALALQGTSAGALQLLALAPAAFATGHFFPTVFGESKGRMLRVFAMDSVGAFLATVLAAFVPILLGFTAYLVVVTTLFLLTAAVVSRVAAKGPELAPEAFATAAGSTA